jgi:hypothetical protein
MRNQKVNTYSHVYMWVNIILIILTFISGFSNGYQEAFTMLDGFPGGSSTLPILPQSKRPRLSSSDERCKYFFIDFKFKLINFVYFEYSQVLVMKKSRIWPRRLTLFSSLLLHSSKRKSCSCAKLSRRDREKISLRWWWWNWIYNAYTNR